MTGEENQQIQDILCDDKNIIFAAQLMELFKICPQDGCGKPVIKAPSCIKGGFTLSVSTTCIDGHHFTWHSQPLVGNAFAGNLLVPAAVFITGNSYSSFMEISGPLSVQSFSTWQCYTIQQQYIVPEVEKAWTRHSEAVMVAAAG